MNLGLPSASPDLDRELLFHACPPSSMGRKEFAYALNCLVADSRCSRRRHLYGSAQSSDPELAGASVPACRDHCLRLAPRLAWNRAEPLRDSVRRPAPRRFLLDGGHGNGGCQTL